MCAKYISHKLYDFLQGISVLMPGFYIKNLLALFPPDLVYQSLDHLSLMRGY